MTEPSAKEAVKPVPMRAEILQAAAELIIAEGYSACTMRAVAEKVNIRASSLYHYFGSKEALIVEIMDEGVGVMLAKILRDLDALPAHSGFEQMFAVALRSHLEARLDPFSLVAVYEHVPPVMKRKSARARQSYTEVWRRVLARGQAEGRVREDLDVKLWLSWFLSGLNRVPEWFRPENGLDAFCAMLRDTTLTGIAASARGAPLAGKDAPPQ